MLGLPQIKPPGQGSELALNAVPRTPPLPKHGPCRPTSPSRCFVRLGGGHRLRPAGPATAWQPRPHLYVVCLQMGLPWRLSDLRCWHPARTLGTWAASLMALLLRSRACSEPSTARQATACRPHCTAESTSRLPDRACRDTLHRPHTSLQNNCRPQCAACGTPAGDRRLLSVNEQGGAPMLN